MDSFYNSAVSAPGMPTNDHDLVFQDYRTLKTVYEDNFEAEIAALAEKSGYDSGYFSHDTGSSDEISNGMAASNDPLALAALGYGGKHDLRTHPADGGDLNKPTPQSTYSDNPNKSTTYQKKPSSAKKQKQKRTTENSYESGHSNAKETVQMDSAADSVESDAFSLEQWADTPHRHERFSYRPAHPGKSVHFKKRKVRVTL